MQKDRRKATERLYKAVKVKTLVKTTAQFDKTVREEVLDVLSGELSKSKIDASIRKIKKEANKVQLEIEDWTDKALSTAYADGMSRTDRVLRSQGVEVGDRNITPRVLFAGASDMQPHYQALNVMLTDAYDDFARSMVGVVGTARRTLNDGLRRNIRQKLVTGRLEGQDIRTIKKEIKELAGERGVSFLLDRGGRKWTLPRYAEMLGRTHIMRANNEATLARSLDWDIDIVQISDHGTTTELCNQYEDKIYSISGNSKKYPKLPASPPFHPNCKHSILMRPDLV